MFDKREYRVMLSFSSNGNITVDLRLMCRFQENSFEGYLGYDQDIFYLKPIFNNFKFEFDFHIILCRGGGGVNFQIWIFFFTILLNFDRPYPPIGWLVIKIYKNNHQNDKIFRMNHCGEIFYYHYLCMLSLIIFDSQIFVRILSLHELLFCGII